MQPLGRPERLAAQAVGDHDVIRDADDEHRGIVPASPSAASRTRFTRARFTAPAEVRPVFLGGAAAPTVSCQGVWSPRALAALPVLARWCLRAASRRRRERPASPAGPCPGRRPLAGRSLLGAHAGRARQPCVRGRAQRALRPRAWLHLPAGRPAVRRWLDRLPAAGWCRPRDRLQVQLHPPRAERLSGDAEPGLPVRDRGRPTRSPPCQRRARCRAATRSAPRTSACWWRQWSGHAGPTSEVRSGWRWVFLPWRRRRPASPLAGTGRRT